MWRGVVWKIRQRIIIIVTVGNPCFCCWVRCHASFGPKLWIMPMVFFSVWKTVAARSSDFVVVLLHHLLSDYTATFNHLLTVSMVSFKHDNQNLSQMLTMDEADGKTDVQCVLWKAQMSCILNRFSCLGYFGLSPLAASFLCASMVFWEIRWRGL